MVLFVDLEEDSEPPEQGVAPHWSQLNQHGGREFTDLQRLGGLSLGAGKTDERVNPNRNAVAEALGCYP